MRDPHPENIRGSKVQSHQFKHVVNWGYVSVAIALLVVAYLVWRTLDEDSEDSEDDEGVF